MKPRIKTKCVASAYEARNERIIEFGAGRKGSGGLISFFITEEGTLLVNVYRITGNVLVRTEHYVRSKEPITEDV